MNELRKRKLLLLKVLNESESQIMDPDNKIITETLLVEPILLMEWTTRTWEDLLSEICFLMEMVEAGKKVKTPMHGTDSQNERRFPSSPQGQRRDPTQIHSVLQPRSIQANHF